MYIFFFFSPFHESRTSMHKLTAFSQAVVEATTRGGGTPAPGYYEIFTPGQHQVQERAIEMEAITAANQADEGDVNRASKF